MDLNKAATPQSASKTGVIAAFAAIYVVWGSTYLGIFYALESFPPFLLAAFRFIVAGLLLLGWSFLQGERLPPMSSVGRITLAGLLMLYLGNGAVTWVEQYLPSGLAAIVVATVPLWFVLLDRRQWSYYFSNGGIIAGLLIGFAGVLVLFAGKESTGIFNTPVKLVSLGVLVCGTIGWAVGSLYTKYQQMQGSITMRAGLQMLAAGFAFLVTAALTKECRSFAFSAVTTRSLLALVYLIIFGSLIGYLAYIWLLRVRPASLVGTYAYVNPVVAVFLGWAFAGESISLQQMIGLGIIIGGLLLVNLYKEKTSAPEKTLPLGINTQEV